MSDASTSSCFDRLSMTALVTLSLSKGGLIVASKNGASYSPMSHERLQKCIQLCMSCSIECSRCAAACINEDNVKMLTRCILLNRDCSTLCQVAVSAMSNDNPLAQQICELCADMCDACAEECSKHKHDHCKRCAEVCRQCADECRKAFTAVPII